VQQYIACEVEISVVYI